MFKPVDNQASNAPPSYAQATKDNPVDNQASNVNVPPSYVQATKDNNDEVEKIKGVLKKFDPNKHFLTSDLTICKKTLFSRIDRFFRPSRYRVANVAQSLLKKIHAIGVNTIKTCKGLDQLASRINKSYCHVQNEITASYEYQAFITSESKEGFIALKRVLTLSKEQVESKNSPEICSKAHCLNQLNKLVMNQSKRLIVSSTRPFGSEHLAASRFFFDNARCFNELQAFREEKREEIYKSYLDNFPQNNQLDSDSTVQQAELYAEKLSNEIEALVDLYSEAFLKNRKLFDRAGKFLGHFEGVSYLTRQRAEQIKNLFLDQTPSKFLNVFFHKNDLLVLKDILKAQSVNQYEYADNYSLKVINYEKKQLGTLESLKGFNPETHFLTANLELVEKSVAARIDRFNHPEKYDPTLVSYALLEAVVREGVQKITTNDGLQKLCRKWKNINMLNSYSSSRLGYNNYFRGKLKESCKTASQCLQKLLNLNSDPKSTFEVKVIKEMFINQITQEQAEYFILFNKSFPVTPQLTNPLTDRIPYNARRHVDEYDQWFANLKSSNPRLYTSYQNYLAQVKENNRVVTSARKELQVAKKKLEFK